MLLNLLRFLPAVWEMTALLRSGSDRLRRPWSSPSLPYAGCLGLCCSSRSCVGFQLLRPCPCRATLRPGASPRILAGCCSLFVLLFGPSFSARGLLTECFHSCPPKYPFLPSGLHMMKKIKERLLLLFSLQKKKIRVRLYYQTMLTIWLLSYTGVLPLVLCLYSDIMTVSGGFSTCAFTL